MKPYSLRDQKLLTIWAAACAKRVLPHFEKAFPKDERPRKAITACRTWVRTGVFHMKDIRQASLDAHTAARKAKAKGNMRACFAARAAGQAVATAHVPQHAFGPAYYSLKIAALDSNSKIAKELNWQTRHLPKHLRKDWKDFQSERLPKSLRLAIKIKEHWHRKKVAIDVNDVNG
jgi:hypothetical protein